MSDEKQIVLFGTGNRRMNQNVFSLPGRNLLKQFGTKV